MSYPTRRHLLKSAATLAIAAPAIVQSRRAGAAEFTMRIGSDAPINDPVTIEGQAAAVKIKERTKGAVEVGIFPASQLGAGTDMLSPVRTGGIEGYFFSSAVIANVAPGAAISSIGFAFKDYPNAWAALDGDLGSKIKDEIRGAGMLPVEKVFDIGFRHVATKKIAINNVTDLKGVKLRVPVSPLYVSLFRSLGAAPATMNFADVYSAVQTKLVDGLECPINAISASKMYEVTDHFAVTSHMWDGFWLALNPAAFNRMPQAYRDIIMEEFEQAALRMRNTMIAGEEREMKTLISKGMKVTQPDVAAFRKALVDSGFYAQWKGKFKPTLWASLEQAAGQSL